ncbi:MAG: HAD family phosphatase [Lachnospiraceae bacterium]|nr:HAD family phosphatase [Lachnospiraceae bacterium]
MIRTIIFDIGNVLADFTWEAHYRRFGYTGSRLERLTKATVKNDAWNEYDRGALSDEEVLQKFIDSDPEMEADIRKCLANVEGMVARNDYAIPWIQELKQKGYQTLYLSNFSEKAARECAKALDFLPYMDGGILSWQEKVIKPMPEIYQLLIDRYQLIPEECVFMDDTQKNLTGAEAFGIHTILFKNQEQAREELRRLGVS